MKRSLHILALILSFVIALAFFQLSPVLPGDSEVLVEKKYDSWTGVLRAWVCCRWHSSGSFISWLNHCASSFEKDHPGVYLEFTAVNEQTLREITESNLRPPELLFFSPGILDDPIPIEPVEGNPQSMIRFSNALPVCMGGYTWVINTSLCSAVPDTPIHVPDNPGQRFSRAAEGLTGSSAEIEFSDPGIDLGLTAAAPVIPSLDNFINGKLPALIISQYELSKLIRLRDAGKGPDWQCVPTGSRMYADQLFLGAVTNQQDAAAPARSQLAHAFLHFLLTDESQRRLTSIGAFPATHLSVYPASSPYSSMESMLRSLPLVIPELF